jgi:hypothetical protein
MTLLQVSSATRQFLGYWLRLVSIPSLQAIGAGSLDIFQDRGTRLLKFRPVERYYCNSGFRQGDVGGNGFPWQNGQLVQIWGFSGDWTVRDPPNPWLTHFLRQRGRMHGQQHSRQTDLLASAGGQLEHDVAIRLTRPLAVEYALPLSDLHLGENQP